MALATALVAILVAATAVLVQISCFRPHTLTALFGSVTAIYPGDEVRVAGLKIGTITAVDPDGDHVKVTMRIDRDVPIPADASAVIVAQNLISARYVQLTPAYRPGDGPTLPDDATIPIERTAVPVEWDEVKEQLTRLAAELGPRTGVSTTSVSTFIDTAAGAMEGNGDRLRQTLNQLSGLGRILANGSGDIVQIVKNLQTFISALRDSKIQVVAFNDRLATLTRALDGSRSDLDGAISNLAQALGDVQRFVAKNRDATAEQFQRLSNITQTVVEQQNAVENILHAAPNAFSNAYNIYNPDIGSPLGQFVLNNFSNPVGFICGAIGGVENVTSPETSKLCAQYLGPALQTVNFNYLPFPVNPYLSKSFSPHNLVYTDPALAPGGEGASPGPPEIAPSVSAYTGLPDSPYPAPIPPPAPFPPGPQAPDHLPAPPSPALYPGAPVPAPGGANLDDMLLPAEAPS
ncbi:MCE family protein [Mycobacterium sp. ACS4331]|uniref:MCE family protein n=1 Tax=Mycobacterium sp. ACS4331 TaxID=1834121 RepID=UPI0007FEE94C|nr:MCE family protein [Mycobacterium sp. ACS4331]OBF24840.1 mammalian cell entry protein [Mycobacterium sp. ACS4331]